MTPSIKTSHLITISKVPGDNVAFHVVIADGSRRSSHVEVGMRRVVGKCEEKLERSNGVRPSLTWTYISLGSSSTRCDTWKPSAFCIGYRLVSQALRTSPRPPEHSPPLNDYPNNYPNAFEDAQSTSPSSDVRRHCCPKNHIDNPTIQPPPNRPRPFRTLPRHPDTPPNETSSLDHVCGLRITILDEPIT